MWWKIVVLVTILNRVSSTSYDYKHISGPVSEFDQHKVTNALQSSVYNDDALTEFYLDEHHSFNRTVNVDSASRFSMGIVTLVTMNDLKLTLTDPSGKNVNLFPHGQTMPVCDSPGQQAAPVYPCMTDHKVGDGSEAMPGAFWVFESPLPGAYFLTITPQSMASILSLRAKKALRNQKKGLGDGVLIIENDSRFKLMTEAVGLHSVVGEQIGIVARIFDNDTFSFDEHVLTRQTRPPSIGSESMISGVMTVLYPSGIQEVVRMYLNSDGTYTATVNASEMGEYTLQAAVACRSPDQHAIDRTSSHTVEIGNKIANFAGKNAFAIQQKAQQRLVVHLPLKLQDQSHANATVRPYAEVWCAHGNTPVTFATNLAGIQKWKIGPLDLHWVDLEIDLKWLAKSGCVNTLSLRNVYLADTSSGSIHDTADEIHLWNIFTFPETTATLPSGPDVAAVTLMTSTVEAIMESGYDGEITHPMRHGVPSASTLARYNSSKANVDCDLVIVHGYCTDVNPFVQVSDDFTNACYYASGENGDPVAVENDEFAKNVVRFIETKNVNAFSMLGQSQGGMVILHILNYYHTGMDLITSGRKIQSIATPYLGNSAFSQLGWIVDIIAEDCKVPISLSREGATEWISGIAQENIEETNVYTTEYAPGGAFGAGFCVQLLNIFFQKPNDGATEIAFSNPGTGSTRYPTTVGQCHTDGMEWPWQVLDSGRNAEVNAAAGRNQN